MIFKLRFAYFLFLFLWAELAVAATFSQAQALSYLDCQVQQKLFNDKKFLRVGSKRNGVAYLPPFIDETLRKEIQQEVQNNSPNVIVEALYLLTETPRFNLLYFYNSLLQISALKEVTYYNEEKKLTHPLFGFSHVVENEKTKKPLEDPHLDSLLPQLKLYVNQLFLPDSPALMLYDYSCSSEQLCLKVLNLESLKLKGWTAIAPQRLVFHLVLRKTTEGFVVYALSYAKVASVFGKGERLFSYRIKGLIDWYYQKYLS